MMPHKWNCLKPKANNDIFNFFCDQSSGDPTANVGSNFALSNGEVSSQFGGNLGLGAINLGNILNALGR